MMMNSESEAARTARPLEGKRIIVTRAHHQAADFVRELEALGATVIRIPTIEIRPPQSFQPLDKALAIIRKYDWLILTSVNGVHALKKRLEKASLPASALRHLSIAAIGPATAAEIERLGLRVACTPEEYVAEGVVSALRDQISGKNVLLVRAKVARDVIPRELRSAGAEVEVVEAYETVVPVNAAKKLQEQIADSRLQADAITFTSSSSARNFAAILPSGASPKQLLQGVSVASIGPVTTATLQEIGITGCLQAVTYTVPGVVDALVRHFAAPSA